MLVYLASIRELLRLLSLKLSFSRAGIILSGVLLLILTFLILHRQIHPRWLILSAILPVTYSITEYILKRPEYRQHLIFGWLAYLWLALPLASFCGLGWINQTGDYQFLLPLAIIALVWINDTFAYLTGRLAGKHKMAPLLSPGKTWEGFFGGVIFTILAGWIAYRWAGSYTRIVWLSLSLLTTLVGLLGDLFESGLKRRFHVKNTGSLLPGHGGILDRFDSLLFLAPAVFLLFGFIHYFL